MAIDNRLSIKNRFSRISVSSFKMPFLNLLTGWYKIDEGSGLTVYNYANPAITADKFPDLTITLNPIRFWSIKVGFGSSSPTYNTKAIWLNSLSSLVAGFGASCCFVYVNGLSTNSYPQFWNCQSGIVDSGDGKLLEHDVSIYGVGQRIDFSGYRKDFMGSTYNQFFYNTDKGRWLFFFNYKNPAGGASPSCVGIVKDDGTIITGTLFGSGFASSTIIKQVRLFRYYNATNSVYGYFNGSLGDIMIWKGIHFTLATGEFQIIYDYLRKRYGMSARYGW